MRPASVPSSSSTTNFHHPPQNQLNVSEFASLTSTHDALQSLGLVAFDAERLEEAVREEFAEAAEASSDARYDPCLILTKILESSRHHRDLNKTAVLESSLRVTKSALVTLPLGQHGAGAKREALELKRDVLERLLRLERGTALQQRISLDPEVSATVGTGGANIPLQPKAAEVPSPSKVPEKIPKSPEFVEKKKKTRAEHTSKKRPTEARSPSPVVAHHFSSDDDMDDEIEEVSQRTRVKSTAIEDDWELTTYVERLERFRRQELLYAEEYARQSSAEGDEAETGQAEIHIACEAFVLEKTDDATYQLSESTKPLLHHLGESTSLRPVVIPQRLYNRLMQHQREGLEWLWGHFSQDHGAIVGDEMGLGKTLQIISFLATLHASERFTTSTPALIVAPATTLSQWMTELREWYPPLRVVCLHGASSSSPKWSNNLHQLIEKALVPTPNLEPEDLRLMALDDEDGGYGFHVVLTTYEALRRHQETLLPLSWRCCVLDEGHRIRNPDADITLCCKRLSTFHRFALTGAPIQNNLTELWSLFDFVYPGRLGTLPHFEQEFEAPIRQGSFFNATPGAVHTAFVCASALRDAVKPLLLMRRKKEIDVNLPAKTEHVLFCNMTPAQIVAYKEYLSRSDVVDMLSTTTSKYNKFGDIRGIAFRAIRNLQKICNHPDLLLQDDDEDDSLNDEDDDRAPAGRKSKRPRVEKTAESSSSLVDLVSSSEDDEDVRFDLKKSGKMLVLTHVLEMWRQQGHKVLLFTQGTQTLDMLEAFAAHRRYPYMRMDGSTPIQKRGNLISSFNKGGSRTTFLFLLTTRVGGVGVNLTGATRVVIFDPDWNPTTDTQARERAWRIGQTKPVTIYRLLMSGTIEEKMYHRQIYKQFLTNKILVNPRQRRYFKPDAMRDLFSFKPSAKGSDPSETKQNREEENATEEMFGHHVTKAIQKTINPNEGDGSTSATNDKNKDLNVLTSLLDDEHGFKSAFSHDAVESEAASLRPDLMFIRKQAENVAKRAILTLAQDQELAKRKREEQLSRNATPEPTWTGRNGTVGAPPVSSSSSSSRGGGESQNEASRRLLERMRDRANWGAPAAASATTEPTQKKGLMDVFRDLRALLASAGARGVATSEILRRFKPHLSVGGDEDALNERAETFRKVLQELAVCNAGKWKLRKKYRDDA